MAKLFPWNSGLEMEDLTEEMQRIAEDTACPSPFQDNGRKLARFRPAADVIEGSHAGGRVASEYPSGEIRQDTDARTQSGQHEQAPHQQHIDAK